MKRNRLHLLALGALVVAGVVVNAQRAGQPYGTSQYAPLAIGAPAPNFSLKGTDGKLHTLSEYRSSPVLAVAFISNHCPASQLYESRLQKLVQDYGSRGVKLIAIAPNGPLAVSPRELNYTDVDDSFESMIVRARHRKFLFPYLYDGATQSVSQKYGPRVTPHIFIFDRERKLRYEGRIDDNMRESGVKSHDVRTAIDAVLAGTPVPVESTATFGCSTKWNEEAELKQQEVRDWKAQPVTVETAGAATLRALRANPTGKMLMVNFWATWCAPCAIEYPALLETHLWYRTRDFELVSVSTDVPEDRPGVLKFLRAQHSAVRNLQFDSDEVYPLMAAFEPGWKGGVPFTMVIAPDGSVVYRRDGIVDVTALRRTILGRLPDTGRFAGNAAYWAPPAR